MIQFYVLLQGMVVIFEIKSKHEIIVAPLRKYIEEWLKNALNEITEPENQETVREVMPPQTQ